MNKCIIPTILISTLLLSNCAKINEYRKSPSEWGKEKVKRSVTIENSPFPNRLRDAQVVRAPRPQSKTIPTIEIPKTPNIVAPTRIQPAAIPTPIQPNAGRVVSDFIEPDITSLPDSKDLQESDNVAPIITPIVPTPEIPKNPVIRDEEPLIPSLPFQNDPNDGLIPPP